MASWSEVSEEAQWKALEAGWSDAKGIHGSVVKTYRVRYGGHPALVAVTKVLWEKYSLFVLDGGWCRMVENVSEEDIKTLTQTPRCTVNAHVNTFNVINIQNEPQMVGWAVSSSSRTLHHDQNCSGGAYVPVNASQAERLQVCQKCGLY